MLNAQSVLANDSIEDYVPPAMFSQSDKTSKSERKQGSHYKSGMAIHGDVLLGNPQIIAPKTSKADAPFKPPLPPRRPVKFNVSKEYLESITGKPAPHVTPQPIETPQYNNDYDLEIRNMDVLDVYQNIE